MRVQNRHRLARVLGIVAGLAAFASGSARLVADTRQVSVESLIYDLKSPDPVRRQFAARQLGVVRYRPAIPHLIPLAHDPVVAVRRDVEISLEWMSDAQALPGLIAFASDMENDIRSRAVSAIVNVHLPQTNLVGTALTKISEIITSEDEDLEVIVEPDVPVDPIVVETLRARLVDPQRGIRRTAIRGLGILRAQPAVPDLLQVVREDRDDGLRFESVRALRKIDDRSVAEQLVPLLNLNSDAVRNELIATIGIMGYRGAVPELTRIVEQAARTDKPRIVAFGALADIADPSSFALFDRLKADDNEMMRLYANEGIARTADPSVKTAISGARLVEKSARVRTAQAFALLRFGQGEYLDELIRDLERPATRNLAKEYLLETAPADRSALFMPRPVSSNARAQLAEVLGRMRDPEARPVLEELTRDPNSDVSRAAKLAVRRMNATSSQ